MAEKKSIAKGNPIATLAYEVTTWEEGDIITAEKLNKIEQALKQASERPMTPGPAGKNGSCLRVSATELTDSKADIQPTALTPTNAEIPYAVGDIVLCGTNKKVFKITKVSAGVATIGTALCTLP